MSRGSGVVEADQTVSPSTLTSWATVGRVAGMVSTWPVRMSNWPRGAGSRSCGRPASLGQRTAVVRAHVVDRPERPDTWNNATSRSPTSNNRLAHLGQVRDLADGDELADFRFGFDSCDSYPSANGVAQCLRGRCRW